MTIAALFLILLLCLLTGMPIAFALGLSSISTILMFSYDSLASIALKLFASQSEHYTLLAIPFFILSSTFLSTGGVANRIINFAIDCVGWIRGGLAMASVLACMIFAAVSGSSPATVAAIGSIVIAGMVQAGYPKQMAAGVITNAGTLGILIPPSIVMLVYAAATEESAARLFMAGFLPGLLMGTMLMIVIYIVARVKGLPAQPWVGAKNLVRSGASASWGLMLIVIVLGSIYGGICSPTEAAAISAVYAFFIAIFIYRDMGPIKGEKWRKNEDDGIPQIIVHNLLLTAKALPLSLVHKDTKKVL
ncbi:MAG TPA: TRAP transporter large permease subunit, partial [Geothermobacteraceae bacterium]|nr:TRAP transporter large permease subunit [Geothermobacteraceae bacterium]